MSLQFKVDLTPPLANIAAQFRALNKRIPNEALVEYGWTVGRQAANLLERPTRNWKRPRSFKPRVSVRGGGHVQIEVPIDDPLYALLNRGADPHPIAPRGPWPLRFREGYRASTKPGSLASGVSSSFGNEVHRMYVKKHPGFEGRDFVGTAERELEPDLVPTARRIIRPYLANAFKSVHNG